MEGHCLVGGFLQAIVGAVAKEQYVSIDYYVIYYYFLKCHKITVADTLAILTVENYRWHIWYRFIDLCNDQYYSQLRM